MERLTYKQAESKIIDAYFKDEILPLDPDFCFCGTLTGNDSWCINYKKNEHLYNKFEYAKIERALLIPLIPFGAKNLGKSTGDWSGYLKTKKDGYEDALFIGMSNALDVLKSIHKKCGEIIDEQIQFKKRELATSKQLNHVP